MEKATLSSDATAEAANLHAALMLSFCAFEAHINLELAFAAAVAECHTRPFHSESRALFLVIFTTRGWFIGFLHRVHRAEDKWQK